ncbi:hypothetical protein ACRWOO_02680 [Streptomyces sp. NEAU-PBA10]|uniref:Uncharacterized protein n=1 Tax=Streptomyces tremellae TaxID=1124239 RepID=A0ABP7DZI6_9ACTN
MNGEADEKLVDIGLQSRERPVIAQYQVDVSVRAGDEGTDLQRGVFVRHPWPPPQVGDFHGRPRPPRGEGGEAHRDS